MFKYQKAYELLLDKELKPKEDGEVTVNCRFHPDNNPSCCINLNNGLFKCHGCGKEGNFIIFIKLFREFFSGEVGLDATEMIDRAKELAGMPEINNLFLSYWSELTGNRYNVEKILSTKNGIKVCLKILQDAKVVYTNTPNLSSAKSRRELGAKFIDLVGGELSHLDCDLIELERRCRDKFNTINDKNEAQKEEIPLTPEEEQIGLGFLRSPNLVEVIQQDLMSMGVVGEEINVLLLYLAGTSRILPKPISIVIKGTSSGGKSYIVTIAIRLMPSDAVKEYSSISAKALTHMKQEELKNKILIVYERPGAEASDYNIRVMQSEGNIRIATTVKDPETGNFTTIEKEVEGPIAYIETTTKTSIHPENETRVFILYIDESVGQTENIHLVQKEKYIASNQKITEELRKQIIKKHNIAQKLLKPYKVEIPYVHEIEFPSDKVRSRRDHDRFLSLIECIALLHQYQREKVVKYDEEYIVANIKDYEIAYQIVKKILEETLSEIPPKSRELLRLCENLGEEFTRKDIQKKSKWTLDEIRKYVFPLSTNGYIEEISGGKGKTYKYKVISPYSIEEFDNPGIISPDQLVKKIKYKEKAKLFIKEGLKLKEKKT